MLTFDLLIIKGETFQLLILKCNSYNIYNRKSYYGFPRRVSSIECNAVIVVWVREWAEDQGLWDTCRMP